MFKDFDVLWKKRGRGRIGDPPPRRASQPTHSHQIARLLYLLHVIVIASSCFTY